MPSYNIFLKSLPNISDFIASLQLQNTRHDICHSSIPHCEVDLHCGTVPRAWFSNVAPLFDELRGLKVGRDAWNLTIMKMNGTWFVYSLQTKGEIKVMFLGLHLWQRLQQMKERPKTHKMHTWSDSMQCRRKWHGCYKLWKCLRLEITVLVSIV